MTDLDPEPRDAAGFSRHPLMEMLDRYDRLEAADAGDGDGGGGGNGGDGGGGGGSGGDDEDGTAVGSYDDDDEYEYVSDPRRALSELEEIPHTWIELEKVPRHLWEQTLAALHPQQRGTVAYRVADPHLREIASALAFKLDMDACERRNERDAARHRTRRSGFPLPTPTASHAVARQTVQVNLRLRADDHERLAQAADSVGLRPTTLARALVLNGAGRILQEHAGQTAQTTVQRRTHGYP